MNQDIEKRIDDIISKVTGGAFEEDVAEARAWKESVNRAFLTKDIEGHEGIQLIIKRFTASVEDINLLLLNANSTKLPDKERDRLIDKKGLYQEFISLFPAAEKEIEQIEKVVSENEEFLDVNK